jgi:hypothetical protein
MAIDLTKDQLNKMLEDPKLREELAKAFISKRSAETFESEKVQTHISKLKTGKALLGEDIDFEVDDIVIWKDDLKNRSFPQYNQPCIVMTIYETPFFDEDSGPGTPLFKEPLDLLLGVIMDNGEFFTYHYDKRRFKKYKD